MGQVLFLYKSVMWVDLTAGTWCVRLTSNTRDAACWLLDEWLLDSFIFSVHSGPPQMVPRASLMGLGLQPKSEQAGGLEFRSPVPM